MVLWIEVAVIVFCLISIISFIGMMISSSDLLKKGQSMEDLFGNAQLMNLELPQNDIIIETNTKGLWFTLPKCFQLLKFLKYDVRIKKLAFCGE